MTREGIFQHVSADEFKAVFRHQPSGIAIVTADAGDGPVAMTVSSLFSVSVTPPTFVFSASPLSSATPVIREAGSLIAHLLTADQLELAELASRSGADRFGDTVVWDRMPTGEPYYPDAATWLRGRIVDLIDIAGSTLVVVEVAETGGAAGTGGSADGRAGAPPLVYHNRSWHALGPDSLIA